MVDFNSVKQQVSSMVGMKFGSFDASVQNMNSLYKQGKRHPKLNTQNGYSQEYIDSGKKVAEAFYNYTDTQTALTIYDNKTKRAYSTGWQDKNNNPNKFTRIDFTSANGGRYSIVDSNGNGYVDKEDTVKFNGQVKNGEQTSIKLSDLLA